MVDRGIAKDYYTARGVLRELSGKRISIWCERCKKYHRHALIYSRDWEDEWWWGCDEFTIQTHLVKLLEERAQDFIRHLPWPFSEIEVPPVGSELSKSIDQFSLITAEVEPEGVRFKKLRT